MSFYRLAANKALGRVHGDGADGVLAEMLRNFEDEAGAVVVGLKRVHDRRQVLVELHIDHGACHLDDDAVAFA